MLAAGVCGRIQTPLLIVHSEGDLRCPITEADQLFAALVRQGKEVLYVRYPAESSHACRAAVRPTCAATDWSSIWRGGARNCRQRARA
jgi:hypothetical protein